MRRKAILNGNHRSLSLCRKQDEMNKIFTTNFFVPDQHKYQLWRIMRITAFILLAAIMQVSAASFAQKISLSEKKTSLAKVFIKISQQSGYDFMVTGSTLKDTKPVTIDVKNMEISDVLKTIFLDQPVTYTLNDKVVTVSRKETSLLDRIIERFQAIDVTGKLVDENGQPIAGATIKVKGTSISTFSNIEGVFVLKNVSEGAVLEISYLGYQVREVKASQNLGSIRMEMAVGKLDEVTINAGYYTVTDRKRTGNISRITSKDIEKQPINNVLIAMQGNVPGLQVTQSNGIPGGGFTVRVRGQNSINSGNDPLYIIDGVNYPSTGISSTSVSSVINNVLGNGGANPLSLINPNDIESIEILRDADATAIYGSRGSNGVILITTKRGKQGVTNVNAAFSQGVSTVGHKLELLNTQQYLQMRKEAYTNVGMPIPTTPNYDNYDLTSYDQNKYTDWQKYLIGGTASLTNASLNLTGGSSKSNYLIAGNYTKEGTVLPGDFGFQRASVRSNVNLGGDTDRLHASLTINLSHTESDLLAYPGSLESKILLPPNAPDVYDEYGELNWANGTIDTNPMADLLNTSDTKTDNVIANLTLRYRIISKLILTTSLGYNTVRRQEFRKSLLAAVPPYYGYTSTYRAGYFGNNYNNNFTAEPQLSYSLNLGKGKFESLLGASIQRNNSLLNVIGASNFSSDDLLENIGSAGTLTTEQNAFVRYRYFASFGRLNYNYADKYILNLTARRDGSSRFGPGKQFSNFGAIGAAWIFSEEKLIKEKLPFLSFGKLRASYGVTGNDQISDYRYLQLWNSSNVYQGTATLAPVLTAANSLFAWEANRKLEIGSQLRFLNDRISLETSWYRNRSSNLLINQSLPLSVGSSSVFVNLPAEVQNTGWEFDSDFVIVKHQNWNWLTGMNITIPTNKLISYPGLDVSGNVNTYQIGQPLNILKTYNTSVNPQTGSYVLEDTNGNGRVDDGDRNIPKFLGQIFYGGLNNSFSYKQFNLDILFSFAKQNGRSYLKASSAPGSYPFGAISNQLTTVLNRWKNPSDQTDIAKFTVSPTDGALYSSVQQYGDISVVDASYIRLRNVSLGYSFPRHLLNVFKITNAMLSLNGQNLFTLTKYVGLDPETQGLSLPPLRTVSLGINITF